jgi:rod shape-determining protein MreB
MIVDIGGGRTEIAALSLGRIVEKSTFDVAGDEFNNAIINFIYSRYIAQIGSRTAEEIKERIKDVSDSNSNDEPIYVKGRSMVTGGPMAIREPYTEIVRVLSDEIQKIIEEIKRVLRRTSPELAWDIKKEGIFIVGGGAYLNGIDKIISEKLGLKVTISDDPLNAVINGINVMLKNSLKYSRILISTISDYK